jgi:hypothetical protein
MPMATIHRVGGADSSLYHIHYLDQRTDPGYGHGGGMHPDQGLPGSGARPDQGLPGSGARPDQGLPGSGGYPSQGLPGGGHIDNNLPGAPGHPDNRPPSQPPQVAPGHTLVMIRSADGKWHYASIAPGSPPPRPEPVPPHPSGQPVPPTATPTR